MRDETADALDQPVAALLEDLESRGLLADTLVAFAHMGSAYASRISRNARPKVALLSNGAEPGQDAHETGVAQGPVGLTRKQPVPREEHLGLVLPQQSIELPLRDLHAQPFGETPA